MTPALSVVIPAKDEAHRIRRTLDRLVESAADLGVTEVIVVDDGSRDGTADVVREYEAFRADPAGSVTRDGVPAVRVLQHEVNRGKSASLRTGMRAATGDVFALFDADLSVPPEHLVDAVALIEAGADVVTGRRIERETQPLVRRLGSRGFAFLQRAIVGLPFSDTQCPFKVVRRQAALAILPRLFVERWNFDVEFLVVARRLGFDVRELPVEWRHVEGSTIRLTPGYFIEQPRVLWQIRRRHGSGNEARG